MNWYIEVMKKYAVFGGRARRKEYWMFFLMNLIVGFVIGFIEGFIQGATGRSVENASSVISTIYFLGTLVPSIAVGVRRMHDTDHSGWWVIVPIIGLFFLVREGTKGENRFGADPKLA